MTRSRSQLRMGNPDVLLLFALLARPHRHARILRTKPLSTSTISAQESRLAPQAAKPQGINWIDIESFTCKYLNSSFQSHNNKILSFRIADSQRIGGLRGELSRHFSSRGGNIDRKEVERIAI